jgi:hypothetical protein
MGCVKELIGLLNILEEDPDLTFFGSPGFRMLLLTVEREERLSDLVPSTADALGSLHL